MHYNYKIVHKSSPKNIARQGGGTKIQNDAPRNRERTKSGKYTLFCEQWIKNVVLLRQYYVIIIAYYDWVVGLQLYTLRTWYEPHQTAYDTILISIQMMSKYMTGPFPMRSSFLIQTLHCTIHGHRGEIIEGNY